MGTSSITGQETFLFADNISFDGTPRGGGLTTNGQLFIGSTTAPHIKPGTLGSSDGSITWTVGSGTITGQVTGGTSVVKTLTGTSGGAISPTSGNITFSGGTSGLTLAGAGSTLTFGGTLAVTNGGTNATSFTQSNGIVTYNGTSLVNYAGPQLDSSGRYTNTSQPCFLAYKSSSTANATGDGTSFTVIFDTEVYDQSSSYDNTTGIFTAPVTGKYAFYHAVYYQSLGSGNIISTQALSTSLPFTYQLAFAPTGNSSCGNAVTVNMTAGDTMRINAIVNGGTKTVTVYGAGGDGRTVFSGFLIC